MKGRKREIRRGGRKKGIEERIKKPRREDKMEST